MAHLRTLLLLAVVGLAGGCTNKEYVFQSEPMGHGPDEYEIYTDRTPRSVFKGEETVRAGVMILPPMQPLVRNAARQKEVLIALQQFYEKMYTNDERRAKDTVKWMNTFMTDHRGLAPDQPVAIQSALDTLIRSRERLAKLALEASNESEKAAVAERSTKLEEEIVFFTKYVEERPAKAAEYQRKVEELEASNKRMTLWQARHVRMANTYEWTQSTKGSADAELNRAMRELAETMTHPDDQTKMEVLAMAVNIGGTDAKEMLASVKAVAADTNVNAEVRAFAAKAAQSIEAQAG